MGGYRLGILRRDRFLLFDQAEGGGRDTVGLARQGTADAQRRAARENSGGKYHEAEQLRFLAATHLPEFLKLKSVGDAIHQAEQLRLVAAPHIREYFKLNPHIADYKAA